MDEPRVAVADELRSIWQTLAERRGWFSPRPWSLILQSVLFGLIWLVGASWARRTLFRTAVNRRLAFSVGALTVAVAGFTAGAALIGLPTRSTLLLRMPVFCLFAALLAAWVDRRLILSALSYLVGFVAAVRARAWVYEVFAVSTALAYLAYVWPEHFCSSRADGSLGDGPDELPKSERS
ncbi:MAG: hypothetical protein ACOY3Y_03485 [Acidobacteriota bacterium]